MKKTNPATPPTAPGAGYSGTPLAKKLGIGPGTCLLARHAPPDYAALLQPLPAQVRFVRRVSAQTDLVHVFVTGCAALERELRALRESVPAATPVWVSWPKQSSGIATEVTEGTIRQIALPLGFVDVKVCAVSEIWSALKLVIRRELRAPANPPKAKRTTRRDD